MRGSPVTWTAVGSGLVCPVAVARPSAPVVDLFARRPTGELLQRQGDGASWGPWRSLGLPVGRLDGSAAAIAVDWQLAACSGSPDTIDLLARSPDGDLLHLRHADDGAGAFEVLGAPATLVGQVAVPMGLASAPAACSIGHGEVDVFAVGRAGEVLHTAHDGSGWSGFTSLSTPQTAGLFGLLAACACGPVRMGVLARGLRGDLLLDWWDGQRWSGFSSLGMPSVEEATLTFDAPLTGPPAACSWGPARMDVFVRGAAGDLLHRSWNGSSWSSYESLGMPRPQGSAAEAVPFTGAVTACAPRPGRVDVFARALDGVLYHAALQGTWDHG